MRLTSDNFRPWLWLAQESVWPIAVFAAPCVAWATRGTDVIVMDAIGGGMLVAACWIFADKLRDLRDTLDRILRETRSLQAPTDKDKEQ